VMLSVICIQVLVVVADLGAHVNYTLTFLVRLQRQRVSSPTGPNGCFTGHRTKGCAWTTSSAATTCSPTGQQRTQQRLQWPCTTPTSCMRTRWAAATTAQ
jgi:hypothetical protein